MDLFERNVAVELVCDCADGLVGNIRLHLRNLERQNCRKEET